MVSKPSSDRLSAFERYCREWMDVFGLGDWVSDFKYGVEGNSRAEVSYNHTSRQATFCLSRKKSSDRDLRMTALHEVWHLLLADLSGMAEEIKNANVVVAEEHRIIARVERYIGSLEVEDMAKKGCKGKGGKGKDRK